MFRLTSLLMSLGLALCLTITVAADEKTEKKKGGGKEVTLKGEVCCGKCALKLEGLKACHVVIKVKDGGKDVIYFFDKESHKKYHDEFCTATKECTVVGKVTEREGKKLVAVSKLEEKK
jgi:hypothetical protein